MAIPVKYLNFKAAGIYRIVNDLSTVLAIDTNVRRLVIGYSEKGPFNSPTYVESQSDFTALFGGISKKLEKRGIYFHRLALECLEEGPIIALNLKKFDGEVVDTLCVDLSAKINAITTHKVYVEDIYDTTRFWTLDAQKLDNCKRALLNSDGTPQTTSDGEYRRGSKLDAYLKIAATSTKETSATVFIRPASGNFVSQYNMTVADWYKSLNEDLPEYFEGLEDTILADYFAQVYVFSGKFNPTQVLASDTLNKYFDGYTDKYGEIQIKLKSTITDAYGDKIDPLEQLFQEDSANPLGRYTGALIPYFKDAQGNYAALDILFNQDQETHNLMMSFREDLLEDSGSASLLDLSGNNIFATATVEDLLAGSVKTSALGNDNATINVGVLNVTETYHIYYNDKEISDSFYVKNDSNVLTAIEYTIANNLICNADGEAYETNIYDINGNLIQSAGVLAEGAECIKDEESTVSQGVDADADTTFGVDSVMLCQILNELDFATLIDADKLKAALEEKGYTSDEVASLVTDIQNGMPDELKNADPDKVIVVENDSMPKLFNVGDSIVGTSGEVGIVQAVGTFNYADSAASYAVSSVEKNVEGDVDGNRYVIRVDQTLNSEIGNLCPLYLEGYTYNHAKPEGTTDYYKLKYQEFMLSALTDYKGLRTGLLSKADLDYRYIVDTFQSFVEANCKKILAYLAKEKETAFAILNFPAVQTFVKSEQPSFTNTNGVFNVQYVVDGYNKKKASAGKFSLPTETQGASFCAFYTPLKFSDGYVDSTIPSAALVSNLFVDKYYSRHPYDIIAGPKYGLITESGMTGPDYNYTQSELLIIEPFGVNCLVYRPGFGVFINANQTAKQTPKSALSSVNVRELVIFLQEEIGKVLQEYQWEFNNPTTRQAIKDRADQICSRAKSNGGIQKFLNVIDESNNDADIIDNEMCVLSTHIEPGRGCGKMIHELTLYRTGGMSSLIKE